MPLDRAQLCSIPLFADMTDQQLEKLGGIFQRSELRAGEKLCSAGEPARAFHILTRGAVSVAHGGRAGFELSPPSPIGELGALAGIERSCDATVTQDAEVWRVSRADLLDFLKANAELGVLFYQSLTELVADKMRRDQLRLEDLDATLRHNQSKIESLRDMVERSEETPLDQRLRDILDELVGANRRVAYRVAPPASLPASVRIAGGEPIPLLDVSRTHISYRLQTGEPPGEGEPVSGVLQLAAPGFPMSGVVFRRRDRRITVALDELTPDHAAAVEGYLSRVRMIDFIV